MTCKQCGEKDAVIARMEEALRFYGDERNYEVKMGINVDVGNKVMGLEVEPDRPIGAIVLGDGGEKARQALKEVGR